MRWRSSSPTVTLRPLISMRTGPPSDRRLCVFDGTCRGCWAPGVCPGVREDRIAVLDWGAYSPVGQDSGAERRRENPPGRDPSLTAAVRRRNTERHGSLIAPASAHTPPL